MNFFEAQDRARRRTGLLVVLFILAAVILAILADLVLWAVLILFSGDFGPDGTSRFLAVRNWQVFIGIGGAILFAIFYASVDKIMALAEGGKAVVELLSAKRIPQETNIPGHRILLNVVAEVAIASGAPAPQVYVLPEERGINAFVAGHTPDDTVVCVTQGMIDYLGRDELQGVIAHEFSHMLNGDMRLNVRLTGLLRGILVVGFIGRCFMRSSMQNPPKSLIFAVPGLLLLGLGFIGSFLGALIKLAVGRQREFLADASAVQFTRDPAGLAGALKKIGGLETDSKVSTVAAQEISHFFFAEGTSGVNKALLATHPTLAERIRRIEPGWDGKYIVPEYTGTSPGLAHEAAKWFPAFDGPKRIIGPLAGVAAFADIAGLLERSGGADGAALEYAHRLVGSASSLIGDSACDPYLARALIYALVLDGEREVRAQQLADLDANAEPDICAHTRKLFPQLEQLGVIYRLPLIEIALPALKELSVDQYKAFKRNLNALSEKNGEIDLFEWLLRRILFSHLDGHFRLSERPNRVLRRLGQLKEDVAPVFSALAHVGHRKMSDGEQAFAKAVSALDRGDIRLLPPGEFGFAELDSALDKLAFLSPLLRRHVLKACAACVAHDGKVTVAEIELLRAVAAALDCPIPLVVPAEAATKAPAS
jgi:Zn-dependent protease with chaperone function